LTSDTLDRGEMYDAASTIIAQKISQAEGVGQVTVGGASLPAVHVELNPTALNKYAIGLDEVRAALAAANANRPKGAVELEDRHWQIMADDQAKKASQYIPLIVAYRNGAAVRLSDVAEVVDSVEDVRNARATLIPAVAVPVSLVATFGVMYLAGFSLNNLSLMALTIATGFVVDDAIVVLENVSRHIERGMKPFQAALKGAREVSFTVVSMSFSLIAVFIPILFMGGIVGRLFREFAVTLSVAILVSLLVSLSATPMMCARLLKPAHESKPSRLFLASEGLF